MPAAFHRSIQELTMNRIGISRLAVLWLMSLLALPLTAAAQDVCGAEQKEAAAKELGAIKADNPEEKLAAEARIYEKYKFCLQGAQADDSFLRAARQCGAGVSLLGNTFFEEMSCCGYDPQRRTFGCPVKVKQRFGFGGAPLPGSREYVLNCVVDGGGNLLPVGVDSVHLSNEQFGTQLTWQFAVIANANQNLHAVQPMNGITRRARSILSWGFQPTGCNFQPIWGNALDYHIRLDQ
jgi:hypothetical protein